MPVLQAAPGVLNKVRLFPLASVPALKDVQASILPHVVVRLIRRLHTAQLTHRSRRQCLEERG